MNRVFFKKAVYSSKKYFICMRMSIRFFPVVSQFEPRGPKGTKDHQVCLYQSATSRRSSDCYRDPKQASCFKKSESFQYRKNCFVLLRDFVSLWFKLKIRDSSYYFAPFLS